MDLALKNVAAETKCVNTTYILPAVHMKRFASSFLISITKKWNIQSC